MYKAALLPWFSSMAFVFQAMDISKKAWLAYSYCTFVNTEFLVHKTVKSPFVLKVM